MAVIVSSIQVDKSDARPLCCLLTMLSEILANYTL